MALQVIFEEIVSPYNCFYLFIHLYLGSLIFIFLEDEITKITRSENKQNSQNSNKIFDRIWIINNKYNNILVFLNFV